MLSFLPKSRILLLPVLLSCLGSAALARTTTDLSGDWTFAFEKEPAITVQVPHCWDSGNSPTTGTPMQGTGIYSKELKDQPRDGKRYYLFFEGAAQTAEVLVNGKKAGEHEGSFTSFCFEITPLLEKDEKNTVTVRVSNNHDKNTVSPGEYLPGTGGIHLPVLLIETDDICIQPDYFASPGVFISQEKVSHSAATVKVRTLVSAARSHSGPVKVEVTILDPRGYEAAYSCSTVTPEHGAPLLDAQELTLIHPLLWQGRDNPYLHKVRVTLTGAEGQKDEVEQPLGFRLAEIHPDKGFVLNDYRQTLKGVSLPHAPNEKKAAASEEEIMRQAREMGATALRTAQYPRGKALYDLCDRTGIVVWMEIPTNDNGGTFAVSGEKQKRQMSEFLLQHGNHPSICLWASSGNRQDGEHPEERILTAVRGPMQKMEAGLQAKHCRVVWEKDKNVSGSIPVETMSAKGGETIHDQIHRSPLPENVKNTF